MTDLRPLIAAALVVIALLVILATVGCAARPPITVSDQDSPVPVPIFCQQYPDSTICQP